ncbi:MAG: metalloregulator ArsR/SmtB family transcription factor [Thermodesulfobacteriota bacterium]
MTAEPQNAPDLADEECQNLEVCPKRCIHEDRVLRARRQAPGEEEIADLARLFAALGDPTRLSILTALSGGEMCVCDLAAFLSMTDSAVSHQLRRLRDAGLVRRRRQGQVLYYRLDGGKRRETLLGCLSRPLSSKPVPKT